MDKNRIEKSTYILEDCVRTRKNICYMFEKTDKGSGNTLLRVVRATGSLIKSSQYLNVLNHDIKRKETCDN